MRIAFAILTFCLWASSVEAAHITLAFLNGTYPIISVRGEITAGDDVTFNNVAIPLNNALVVFDSPGGLAVVGMNIGRTISIKGFSTGIGLGETCASSCALAWLAGRPRFITKTARVGFHAIFTTNGGKRDVSSTGNALVGQYLQQLGLPTSAIVFVTQARPNAILWLSKDAALAAGIDVQEMDVAPATEAKDNDTPLSGIPIPEPAPVNRGRNSTGLAEVMLDPKLTLESRQKFKKDKGTEIMAKSFSVLLGKTEKVCEDICGADNACQAFNYYRSGTCVKFRQGTPIRLNDMVLSGQKRN